MPMKNTLAVALERPQEIKAQHTLYLVEVIKMNKKQKKFVIAGVGGMVLYSLYRQSTMGLSGFGFLTLPYEYSPSAPTNSYSQSYSRPMYNEYSYDSYSYSPYDSYSYSPVKFTSDNRSPYEEGYSQIPSFSSKMEDSVFLNMVRQISETDGVTVIENATSMSSTPSLAAGTPIGVLRVVKSQVDSAMASNRLTSDHVAYLDNISNMLSMRIIALTPVDTAESIGGIF